MSTAEYLITVLNKSDDTPNYIFFNQARMSHLRIGWIKSPSVPYPNGKARFDVKVANFANCKTAPVPANYGVVVAASDYSAVELQATAKFSVIHWLQSSCNAKLLRKRGHVSS
ncbi:Uncharacterized protein TCAP_03089 [Tolypocladium capitatum]|uniref:Uncharacterized protein n=1 Tax=Tolypocladium capitatum TaxID=45235 RepID=A0A2K3QHF3_9HYPO|nr:Uncharacterized protein TCAP_03089 [Tolypocladium capitatum]